MNKPTQTPIGEQARILPRFRALAERDRQQALVLQRAIGEAVSEERAVTIPGRVILPSPADLRGIPAIGYGVGGVQPGTQPEAACIRKMSREAA